MHYHRKKEIIEFAVMNKKYIENYFINMVTNQEKDR